MCESRTAKNSYASTVELYGSTSAAATKTPNESGANSSSSNNNTSRIGDVGAKVLRIIWHSLYEKYDYLRRRSSNLKGVVERETNKPLAKKFRRSLRLNKSAKKKGYEFFLSDEDKR
ncbi:PREDICTED: uncharacterized protein LOC108382070 [Rhagoletis zephyria]|uniref:uncharacterized protein LOC108382070 n=1 Tax=Rhagoletis zephyria TaxID=28612 RepID=UPI000811A324|nr:PREDICTED: uncharacterized protein LOC108382070 [Rhagoletis zephyria]XP_017493952.1 PREDICTED: uncharacterized protein LOC108382070 [Rhagoletis zephyria]